MSVYLHGGIPSSWNLLQHVVRLMPNIWAASSNVKPELRSNSTCSMLNYQTRSTLVPLHSTCSWELMVDDVTEQVFKLFHISILHIAQRTWTCYIAIPLPRHSWGTVRVQRQELTTSFARSRAFDTCLVCSTALNLMPAWRARCQLSSLA